MNPKGFLLFDIDGVIRDVSGSYRLAIQETVQYFCKWKPSIEAIDELKAEGIWNNDWDVSKELIRRQIKFQDLSQKLPEQINIIKVFSNFYFGGDQNGDPETWKGFIKNEPLLINKDFFQELTNHSIVWGFVSGAEPASAKFLLKNRLGIKKPYLIAMGDAPEKPNPTGLIKLATIMAGRPPGETLPPIGYLGDTVADVLTIQKARKKIPDQKFISLAVAPPHLHKLEAKKARSKYERRLKEAGADEVLSSTLEAINIAQKW